MKAVYTSGEALGFEISPKDLKVLTRCLRLVYDLAEQNVVEDKDFDDVKTEQNNALAIVAAHIAGLENAD